MKAWIDDLREAVPSSALVPRSVLRASLEAVAGCRAEASPTTFQICFIKELFNFYFRDDLYGVNRHQLRTILSSGSADETVLPAPRIFKYSVNAALDRDWYGYSDSRGRLPTREAIAALESVRLQSDLQPARVMVTQGGTAGLALVADCVLAGPDRSSPPILCATPAYAPHVKALAQRATTRPISVQDRSATAPNLDELIAALRPRTPLVLLQTVINPSGSRVPEEGIERLIRAAAPGTLVLLDEAHEPIDTRDRSPLRAAPNVVRLVSLSKDFSVPGMKLGWITASECLIERLYESASTNYGGPPSVFSLALEALARFERWRLAGKVTVATADCREFEGANRAALGDVNAYYIDYLAERAAHRLHLRRARAMVTRRLPDQAINAACGIGVNVSIHLPVGTPSSYAGFRRLLADHGTSVFPGALMWQKHDAECRITLARSLEDLSAGLDSLEKWYAAAA